MTLRQLEHAVTSPSRFLRRLLRDLSTGNIRPLSTRILSPPDLTSSRVLDVMFVAGGRFLMGVASGLQELQIWDLGFSPASVINPRPVLTKRMNGRIRNIIAQPTADSLGVMFLVNTRTETIPPQSLLEIYEMYPESSALELHRLASWKFVSDILRQYSSRLHFSGQYVVAGFWTEAGRGEMLVWNYVDNTAIKWNIGEITGDDEVNLYNDHIVQVGEQKITVWKMPPLHPRIPGVDVHQEVDLPSTSIDHGGYIAVRSNYQQPRGLNGLHVDVVATVADPPEDEPALLKRYVIMSSPSMVDGEQPSDPRAPSLRPFFTGESPVPSGFHSMEDSYLSTWLSDREMIMFRAEHEGYLVRASAVVLPAPPEHLEGHSAHGLVWVGPPEEAFNNEEGPKIPRYTYCPISGRVCVIDGSEIRVMDYLSS